MNPVEKKESNASNRENIHVTYEEYPLSTVDRVNKYCINDVKDLVDLIIPRLYLSDDIAARHLLLLQQLNITHILNVTINIGNYYEKNGVKYKKIAIYDSETQNISRYFQESNRFIDGALNENSKNNVLVHCNAGVSRSASFVIAYLMHKKLFDTYRFSFKQRQVLFTI